MKTTGTELGVGTCTMVIGTAVKTTRTACRVVSKTIEKIRPFTVTFDLDDDTTLDGLSDLSCDAYIHTSISFSIFSQTSMTDSASAAPSTVSNVGLILSTVFFNPMI